MNILYNLEHFPPGIFTREALYQHALVFYSGSSLLQPFYLKLIIVSFSPSTTTQSPRIPDAIPREFPPSFGPTSPVSANSSEDASVGLSELQSAYVGIFGLLGCLSLYCVVLHTYAIEVFHMGMKLRVSSCALVYRKVKVMSLRLRRESLFFALPNHEN